MRRTLWWTLGQAFLITAVGAQDDTSTLRDELRRLAQPSPSQTVSDPAPAQSASTYRTAKPQEHERRSAEKAASKVGFPIAGTYYGHTDVLVNQDRHITCPTVLQFDSNTNTALLTVNFNGNDKTSKIAGGFKGEVFHGRSEGRFFGLVYEQAMNYVLTFDRRSGTVTVTSWEVNPPPGSSPTLETVVYRRRR
jgi:hypothetical protein